MRLSLQVKCHIESPNRNGVRHRRSENLYVAPTETDPVKTMLFDEIERLIRRAFGNSRQRPQIGRSLRPIAETAYSQFADDDRVQQDITREE